MFPVFQLLKIPKVGLKDPRLESPLIDLLRRAMGVLLQIYESHKYFSTTCLCPICELVRDYQELIDSEIRTQI